MSCLLPYLVLKKPVPGACLRSMGSSQRYQAHVRELHYPPSDRITRPEGYVLNPFLSSRGLLLPRLARSRAKGGVLDGGI